MKFSCSGNLATMAPGLPYAIGAQAAYPDRQVVAFVGDGGFTMLMGEFVTAVKHELPIKVVIIKNNTLGQIKWEQMVFLGNPEYGVELHPIDFVKFAEACGGVGFRCEKPEEVRPGAGGGVRRRRSRRWSRRWSTRSSRRCPPQATPKQALHFAESLARGEPERRQDHLDDLQGQDQGAGLTGSDAMPGRAARHTARSMLKDAPAQVEDAVVGESEGVRIYAQEEPARAADPERPRIGSEGPIEQDRRAAPRAGLRGQGREVQPRRRAPPRPRGGLGRHGETRPSLPFV